MLVLAFFDTGFIGGERWKRLREARPASRQHFPLNQPSTLGEYDLSRPDQTAPVVAMAHQAGIDGFVIDLRFLGGAYRHDAAFLARFCGERFGLGFRWRNGEEPVWGDISAALEQVERANALTASLKGVPARLIGGRIPLIVEDPKQLAAPAAAVAALRRGAGAAGLPGLYLIANRAEDKGRFLSAGFDSLIDPSPDVWHSCAPSNRATGLDYLEVMAGMKDSADYLDRFFPYLPFTVSRMLNREHRGKVMPRIFASFHNWLRHPDGGGTHLVSPGHSAYDAHMFGLFIENAMLFAHAHFPEGERAVFLQSWNGWLDGTQIEPSLLDGDLVYDAARRAIDRGRYMIRTRGENPAGIRAELKERIALLCEAARGAL